MVKTVCEKNHFLKKIITAKKIKKNFGEAKTIFLGMKKNFRGAKKNFPGTNKIYKKKVEPTLTKQCAFWGSKKNFLRMKKNFWQQNKNFQGTKTKFLIKTNWQAWIEQSV